MLFDIIGKSQFRNVSDRFGIFTEFGSFSHGLTRHISAAKMSAIASGSQTPTVASPSHKNASVAVLPCRASFNRAAR